MNMQNFKETCTFVLVFYLELMMVTNYAFEKSVRTDCYSQRAAVLVDINAVMIARKMSHRSVATAEIVYTFMCISAVTIARKISHDC